MGRSLAMVVWVVASAGLAGCTEPETTASLASGGPPMIAQVLLGEIAPAGAAQPAREVFGFGSYPGATADQAHPVTEALATGNRLRIVVTELLRGEALQEIQCRAAVGDDVFARVPSGATSDDIARCAVVSAELPAQCPASNPRSLCICARSGGCPSLDGMSRTPEGASVGVADADQDGAADGSRFLAGAASIRCTGRQNGSPIDVPLDLDRSYWTPAGNQFIPPLGSFDVLGPAMVLVPGGVSASVLPTGATCGVVFSPEVVSRDGEALCAPAGGDVGAGCTPGDTSAFQFSVEALAFTADINPQAQSRTDDVAIVTNAPLDEASVAGVTVTQAGARYTEFIATAFSRAIDEIGIHWTASGGLLPATQYTITVPTSVTDQFHQAAPQPFQVSFTTAAQ